jgi:hypothetical protein
LGEGGYDELWFFADLRGGHEYPSARLVGKELQDALTSGLVIAHQRHKDGSHGAFLLVELDQDGEVIDDWFHLDLEGAQAQAAARAGAETEGLTWEKIPDTDDVARYVRTLLRRPLSGS